MKVWCLEDFDNTFDNVFGDNLFDYCHQIYCQICKVTKITPRSCAESKRRPLGTYSWIRAFYGSKLMRS